MPAYIPNNNAIYNAALTGFVQGIYTGLDIGSSVTEASLVETLSLAVPYAQAVDTLIPAGMIDYTQSVAICGLCAAENVGRYNNIPASYGLIASSIVNAYNEINVLLGEVPTVGPTGPTGPSGPAGAGYSQTGVALSNGLNSNVVTGNKSSVIFDDYTGPVILGGIDSTVTPGQPIDLFFSVVGQPVTIKNLDSASSSGYQIITGTGQDIFLPPGQTPSCRLVFNSTLNAYTLQNSGAHQIREYNVLDWGFDPTATNANDAACSALAASITASLGSSATLAGGTARVFFPRGKYLFANPITGFPSNCHFEGAGGNGINSILVYTGEGVFWATENVQSSTWTDLGFTGASTDTTVTKPSLSNIIVAVTNLGGLYEVTTAVAHGYVTGDLVGIYGVTGCPGANCPANNPWTITVIDTTHYTLNGSVFAGSAYTSPSINVSGATNAAGGSTAPCIVTTTTPAMLDAGQLAYIAGVGGNTAVNGLMRVPSAPTTTLAGTASVVNGTFQPGSTSKTITFTTPQSLPAGAILNFGGNTSYVLSAAIVAGTTGTLTTAYQGTTASGLTVTVTGPGASSFPVAINIANNVQPGSGAYTSGGTVKTGASCLLYSRQSLVGLALQGINAGNGCVIENCTFLNWKYGISLDGAETSIVRNCIFGTNEAESGYSWDQFNWDSTHTAAGIRLGAFTTYPDGNTTNQNKIENSQFSGGYAGVLHQDGVGNLFVGSNYECQVVAILVNASQIVFEKIQNDGSNDTIGLIQCLLDSGGGNVQSLTIRDAFVTCVTAPLISGPAYNGSGGDNGSFVGLAVEGENVINSKLPILNNLAFGMGGPVKIEGIYSAYNPLTSQGIIASDTLSGGVTTIGKTVNHQYPAASALDTALQPFYGNVKQSGHKIRNPANDQVYHDRNWTPAVNLGGIGLGGTVQENDTVYSPNGTGNAGAYHGKGVGCLTLGTSGSPTIFGSTDVPLNNYQSGTITMTVHGFGISASSYWRYKCGFIADASFTITLGAIFESEVSDPLGVANEPIMVLSGSGATQQVSCQAYSSSSVGVEYAVHFDIDMTGF